MWDATPQEMDPLPPPHGAQMVDQSPARSTHGGVGAFYPLNESVYIHANAIPISDWIRDSLRYRHHGRGELEIQVGPSLSRVRRPAIR